MITRLARRFGFAPSVPVAVVDEWLLPRNDEVVALAPRGGSASCLVDRVGRLQPAGATYTLDWTLAAGARWVSAIESERVAQRLVAPAELETTITTPAGPVVQRVAAAVVDGEPVAVVEIENRGGVAVAVGLVARPLVHGGRGFLPEVGVGADGFDLGEQGAIHIAGAAATAVADGEDLLTALPAADAEAVDRRIASRSGGAQGALVLPLPHTARLQLVVELAGATRPTAAVPSIDDVQRGWQRHLDEGSAIAVADTDVADRIAVAARVLLTDWPSDRARASSITALAELGFGHDGTRLFADLDRTGDSPELLAAIARWCQLGDARDQLDHLDAMIGPVARSAHDAASVAELRGPLWLPAALAVLADRLAAIDQPDVAERVRRLSVAPPAADLGSPFGPNEPVIELADPSAAARAVLGTRACLVADRDDVIDLLPAVPPAWRGRAIEAMRIPVEGGSVSFGLRWHGPRPALLWQADTHPVTLTASAIDPSFSTAEPSGETLLADPGWPRP